MNALTKQQIFDRGVCLYDGRKCEVVELGNDGALIIDTLHDEEGRNCFLVPLNEISAC